MIDWYLPFIFFIVALLYSTAGFGGGSTYLAILSLFLTDFYEIRSLALVLNLFVVSISTFLFIQSGIFKWKNAWPFVILSVPTAMLAATLKLNQETFFVILGVALILAAIMMFVQRSSQGNEKELGGLSKVMLGGVIGMFSGLTGIGGGIYLSPTLNLVGWANAKIIASVASFFILCNSIAGISGLVIGGTFELDFLKAGGLIISVILGGFIGSYVTGKFIHPRAIRLMTALLIGVVGTRLIFKYLMP